MTHYPVVQEPTALRIDAKLLDDLTDIVSQAAAAILAIPADALARRHKADQTLVTAADEASDAVIVDGLARLMPGLAVISEERPSRTSPQAGFALVDPLDGTFEFAAGRDEYTVNLAIVRDGRPVAGIVAVPARGLIYRAAAGLGAQRLRLRPGAATPDAGEMVALKTRTAPAEGLTCTVSRSHLDDETRTFLSKMPVREQVAAGSSLKLCWLAEGSADLYPRLAPTSDWDIAAGDAVLSEAGGVILTPGGHPIVYGARPDCRVPAFIAWADPARVHLFGG